MTSPSDTQPLGPNLFNQRSAQANAAFHQAQAHTMTPDQQLRLECLRLSGGSVEHAERYYVFITARAVKTPRQQILDALEAANVK